MRVLFDSWFWIELFTNTEFECDLDKFPNRFIASTINLYEIHRKMMSVSPDKKTAKIFVDKVIALCEVIPVSAEIALRGAELRRKYKFSMADALILATAESEKALLVTGDKDFKGVNEVKVVFI